MSALLIDTDDRRADPTSMAKRELSRWIVDRPVHERMAAAKELQRRVNATFKALTSDNLEDQEAARSQLYRCGLTAASAPVIQSWLKAVIDTGEVPA